jgi:hypothetical protein
MKEKISLLLFCWTDEKTCVPFFYMYYKYNLCASFYALRRTAYTLNVSLVVFALLCCLILHYTYL